MNLTGLVNQAYPSPEWAVFFEVSNSTGFQAKRRADAVALGVWPSRGHALVGFEFKEDRRDWLREKQNPEKADVIASHCDSWYVVAGSDAVVKVEELPEPWGLLVANKDRTRLFVAKVCVPFPDRDKAIMRRSFVASMLRKFTESTVPKSELARLTEDAVKLALERTREGHDLKHLQTHVETLENILSEFKATTGVDLRYGWRGPKKIAAAVEAVLSGASYRDQLARSAEQLDNGARLLREAVEAWPTDSTNAAGERP